MLFIFLVVCSESGVVSGFFTRYANKRLISVTSNITTSFKEDCTIICLTTNGCVAVTVAPVENGETLCGLATSLSDENDMVDDAGSDIYVLGESVFLSS